MARNLDGFAQLARMSAKAQTDNTLFDEIDAVYDRMVEAGERFMETGRDDEAREWYERVAENDFSDVP